MQVWVIKTKCYENTLIAVATSKIEAIDNALRYINKKGVSISYKEFVEEMKCLRVAEREDCVFEVKNGKR